MPIDSDSFNCIDNFENIPDSWPESISEFERLVLIQTRKACPRCGIGIGVMLAPDGSSLEQSAQNLQEQHNQPPPPDAFSKEYAEPVFVFCDNPGCPFHAAFEYARVREVLTDWCEGDAPSWEEYVVGVAASRGWL